MYLYVFDSVHNDFGDSEIEICDIDHKVIRDSDQSDTVFCDIDYDTVICDIDYDCNLWY